MNGNVEWCVFLRNCGRNRLFFVHNNTTDAVYTAVPATHFFSRSLPGMVFNNIHDSNCRSSLFISSKYRHNTPHARTHAHTHTHTHSHSHSHSLTHSLSLPLPPIHPHTEHQKQTTRQRKQKDNVETDGLGARAITE